jgi:hypothetical protein
MFSLRSNPVKIIAILYKIAIFPTFLTSDFFPHLAYVNQSCERQDQTT